MKKWYRKFIDLLYAIVLQIQIFKIWIFEIIDINKKYNKKMIKNVHLTKKQITEIRTLWRSKFPSRWKWHKLYQAFNGTFCKEYFPEIYFSTKLERKLVPSESAKILSDKSLLDVLFGDGIITLPETIVVKSKGNYFDKNRNIITKDKARELIANQEKIVFKPTMGGSSGRGVIISCIENNNVVKKGMGISQFMDLEADYIIQKPIVQCKELSELHSASVNTFRLITYIVNNEIHTADICMRIGVGSAEVDNIHAGGIFIGVSNDGALLREAFLQTGKRFQRHPDTGILFENYKIPKIPDMITIAKELHGRVSRVEMISWDFTIDEDGNPVLIEMNLMGQSIWFPQMCHGKGIFGKDTSYMIQKMKSKV